MRRPKPCYNDTKARRQQKNRPSAPECRHDQPAQFIGFFDHHGHLQRVRPRGERPEQPLACHPRAIFFRREEREAVVFGLHDEFCRFLRRISVMIIEGPAFRDCDARLNGGREKLFRIADAGKGQHLFSP